MSYNFLQCSLPSPSLLHLLLRFFAASPIVHPILHSILLPLLLCPNHLIQRAIIVERGRVLEAAPDAIPQCEVLAVVVVIVHVVIRVMRRAVDDGPKRLGHAEVAVVDGDGPDIDKHIEDQVEQLVHGEQEHVDVVWAALGKPIQGVESMACKRGRHLDKQ